MLSDSESALSFSRERFRRIVPSPWRLGVSHDSVNMNVPQGCKSLQPGLMNVFIIRL